MRVHDQPSAPFDAQAIARHYPGGALRRVTCYLVQKDSCVNQAITISSSIYVLTLRYFSGDRLLGPRIFLAILANVVRGVYIASHVTAEIELPLLAEPACSKGLVPTVAGITAEVQIKITGRKICATSYLLHTYG